MRILIGLLLAFFQTSLFAGTITLTPSDDASIRETVENVNPNASWLDVFASSSIWRGAFIKFDLDDYIDDIEGGDISSATLRIYVQSVIRAGELWVGDSASDWNEDDITGNNYPELMLSTIMQTDILKGDKGSYFEIDLTDKTKAWFDGDDSNYGIAVLPVNTGTLRMKIGSQRVRNKGPQLVLETSDDIQMAFENFPVETANDGIFDASFSDGLASDDVTFSNSFRTKVQTTFTKATIAYHYGCAGDGAVGVGIYEDQDMGSYSETGDMLSSGIYNLDLYSIGDYLDVTEKYIEIDIDPVRLRPDRRYWIVVSQNLTAGYGCSIAARTASELGSGGNYNTSGNLGWMTNGQSIATTGEMPADGVPSGSSTTLVPWIRLDP